MPGGANLASGYIDLTVKYRSAMKQISADFKGLQGDADDAAVKAGKALGEGLSKGAEKGVKDAGKQIVKADFARTLAKELGSAGDRGSRELLKSLAAGNDQAKRSAALAGRNYADALTKAIKGGGREAAEKFEAEFRNSLNARDVSQAFYNELHGGAAKGRQAGEAAGTVFGAGFGRGAKSALAGLGALGITAGAIQGIKKSFESGLDFERTANKLQAVTSATGEQMEALRGKARALGSDISLTGASSADAMAAMTELAKAGFSVEESMNGARGTLQLASAAQISAAEAAEIQANALLAFGKRADYAGTAADVLANAANQSSAEITDVAYALQAGAAVANQFGISMEDTAASIALLANNGIKGSDAGTLLKSMLLAVASPSDQAAGAMHNLGLQVWDAQGNFVGLTDVFEQLQDASERMTPEMYAFYTSTAFGSDAARLAGVAAKEGGEGFSAMADKMKMSGSAAQVAAAQTQGWPGLMERLSNTTEGAKLAFFNLFNDPQILAGGDKLNDLFQRGVDWLNSHHDEVGRWFVSIKKGAEDLWPAMKKIGEVGITVAGGLKDIGTFLGEHPALIEAVVGAFAAWKGITAAADLISSFKAVSTLFRVTLPADAAAAAFGINTAFAGIVLPAALIAAAGILNEKAIQDALNDVGADSEAGKNIRNQMTAPGMGVPGASRDPIFQPSPDLIPGGGAAGASRQRRGLSVIDPSGALGRLLTGEGGNVGGGLPGLPAGGGGRGYNDWAAASAWLDNQASGSYGLPAGTNTGGYGTGTGAVFPPWVMQIAQAFGIKPSTYAGHQESDRHEAGYAPNPNGENRGIDWSGPVENLQRFADYLAGMPQALEQVIWENPFSHQKTGIGGGQINPGYYDQSTYDAHGGNDPNNIHVHTRQSTPIPLPFMKYDTGGVLPPGVTVANNETGGDEYILKPEQLQALADAGIDPSRVRDNDPTLNEWIRMFGGKAISPNNKAHGLGHGQLPGPTDAQLNVAGQFGIQPRGTGQKATSAFGGERTQGYIPAAAGNTGVSGTSFLSGVYNMGAEVVNGVIDQAASMASSAAGAALTAGTMGAGAAGAPAAAAATQALIGMGTSAAKRGVSYGFQMLGIGTDALLEQLTPFGAPRLLTTDVTGFMPQQGIMQAATTSIEKAFKQGQPGRQGPESNPVAHGQQNPFSPGPASPGPFGPAPGPTAPRAADAPTLHTDPNDPNYVPPFGVFDQGGWLQPGEMALNLSKRVEPMPVFNGDQWDNLNAIANTPAPQVDPKSMGGGDYRTIIESVTVKDVAELERQMEDRRRLNTMRYRGRPTRG